VACSSHDSGHFEDPTLRKPLDAEGRGVEPSGAVFRTEFGDEVDFGFLGQREVEGQRFPIAGADQGVCAVCPGDADAESGPTTIACGEDIAGTSAGVETVAPGGERDARAPGRGPGRAEFELGWTVGRFNEACAATGLTGHRAPGARIDGSIRSGFDGLGPVGDLLSDVVEARGDLFAQAAAGVADTRGIAGAELGEGGFTTRHVFVERPENLLCGEDVGEEGCGAVEVGLAPFRIDEDGLGDQTLESAVEGHADLAEHLVHAMGHEDKAVGRGLVIDAVIVPVARVAIPILGQNLEGRVGDEAVDIDERSHAGAALDGIGDAAGGGEGVQIVPISRLLSGVEFEVLIHIPQEPAVVEVAGGIGEIALEEPLVEAFLEDVEAEETAVERDEGVGGACGGHTGAAVEIGTDELGEAAGILDGIVQVKLIETEDLLAGLELVGVEREGRAVIDAAGGTGRAFDADADGLPGVGSDAECGRGGFAGLATERFEIGGCQLDVESEDGALEEDVRGMRTRRNGRGGCGGGIGGPAAGSKAAEEQETYPTQACGEEGPIPPETVEREAHAVNGSSPRACGPLGCGSLRVCCRGRDHPGLACVIEDATGIDDGAHFTEGFEGEGAAGGRVGDRVGVDVDGGEVPGLEGVAQTIDAFDGVEFAGGDAIAEENAGVALGDDALAIGGAHGDGGVFAGTATAEIATGDDDGVMAVEGALGDEPLRVEMIRETPEGVAAELLVFLGDGGHEVEELSRDDLVRVDVVSDHVDRAGELRLHGRMLSGLGVRRQTQIPSRQRVASLDRVWLD